MHSGVRCIGALPKEEAFILQCSNLCICGKRPCQHPDGGYLASTGHDGKLVIWKWTLGCEEPNIPLLPIADPDDLILIFVNYQSLCVAFYTTARPFAAEKLLGTPRLRQQQHGMALLNWWCKGLCTFAPVGWQCAIGTLPFYHFVWISTQYSNQTNPSSIVTYLRMNPPYCHIGFFGGKKSGEFDSQMLVLIS